MSQNDCEKLVHAFSLSRLDHCSTVFTGLSKHLVGGLELIQTSAAKVLVQENIITLHQCFKSVHWLPIHQRIHFKLLLVFKAQHGSAPPCISDLFTDYIPIRPLQTVAFWLHQE